MQISYTDFEAYSICPLKYKYQAIDKIKVPKSKEAVFGTLIHSTLKFIHSPAIVSPTLEQALDYFSKNWKSEIFEDELEERAAFSQGIGMIQDYYKKNDISKTNIIDLESRFSVNISENNETHTIVGFIDRIDKTDEGYEIIDYKTSRKMPSQEAVDNDIQLSIYLKGFLSRYPKEIENISKIKVSLYYLKHGVKLSSTRTLEQLNESERAFLNVIKTIENEELKPIINPLCDWCGYQKICPMWRHKFKELRKYDSEEINKIIAEYIEARSQSTKIKAHIEKLQEKISSYMDQEGVNQVFCEKGSIVRNLRKVYKYDEKNLRKILEPLGKWDDVVKIDGVALKNVLSSLSHKVREEIEKNCVIEKESKILIIKKEVRT